MKKFIENILGISVVLIVTIIKFIIGLFLFILVVGTIVGTINFIASAFK